MISQELKEELRNISISEYLSSIGLLCKSKRGDKIWFSSPFSSDSTPSFVVYEDQNRYFDFSNGKGGDIFDLVQGLNNVSFSKAVKILAKEPLMPIIQEFEKKEKKKKEFNIKSYLTTDNEDINLINQYANKRKIFRNFNYAKYFENVDGLWVKKLGIGFVHVDEDLNVCGIKIRNIDKESFSRFTARGRMCYYYLDNIHKSESTLYITESETSSNSLFEVLKQNGDSFVILCVGGASNYPKRIPDKFSKIKDVKIIIDYDGGAVDSNGNVKYEEHIKNYKLFGDALNIMLDKDSDINTLYCEDKNNLILNLIKK